jgi:hypothetical protein
MKRAALISLVLSAISAHSQSSLRSDPPTVAKVCGKLQHFEEIPVKNAKNTFEDKTKNLPGIAVSLFPAKDSSECCVGISPIAQATTGRWGAFRFSAKNLTSGLYWLVAKTNGQEYKLLVRYEPKSNPDQLCYQTFWELDDAGHFWITETITVD